MPIGRGFQPLAWIQPGKTVCFPKAEASAYEYLKSKIKDASIEPPDELEPPTE
jgi:hypothetical protein